jgi:hypothetical protein
VSERELLRQTADDAADFVETLDTRPIREQASVEELYDGLAGPLPEAGLEPEALIASLVEAASPGLVGIPFGRYFGFVIGGRVPAAVVEEVTRGWVAELLGLPVHVSAAIRSLGRAANWRTTTDDVERFAAAILRSAVPVHA